MKAEHRHQLQTNILADRMGRLYQGVKSAPRSTSSLVWFFAILVVGIVVAWQIASRTSRANRSALWLSVDDAAQAGSVPMLERIASENSGTIAGRSAKFLVARQTLQGGVSKLTTIYRTEGVEEIDLARRTYQELTTQCKDTPLLAQEALMGLATAEESLVGVHIPDPRDKEKEITGDLDTALQYYRQLAQQHPGSVLGTAADKRAQELERDRTDILAFYARFSDLAGLNKKAGETAFPDLENPIKPPTNFPLPPEPTEIKPENPAASKGGLPPVKTTDTPKAGSPPALKSTGTPNDKTPPGKAGSDSKNKTAPSAGKPADASKEKSVPPPPPAKTPEPSKPKTP